LKCESGNWVELGKPAAHLGLKFKGRFIVFSLIFQVKSNSLRIRMQFASWSTTSGKN
jgi:hypothetical protein